MGRIDRARGQDATMERRHIRMMERSIKEYRLIKSNQHPKYQKVSEFFRDVGICRQNFHKYYRRYIIAGEDISALIPYKPGRKFREELPYTEEVIEAIKEMRNKGLNRYDLQIKLSRIFGIKISASSIYRLLKKLNINKFAKRIKEEQRRIIKMYAGEMGHIDIHYITKGTVKELGSKKLYLLGIIDDYSRICWMEVIDSIKAIDVMFAGMEMLLRLKERYDVQFESIMSDNGSEFSSRRVESHPFEKMLRFYDIKHIYTKPFRPQTNGKIERFWKSIEDELLEGERFESLEEFKEHILGYVLYYNEHRVHQGINNITPKQMLKKDVKRRGR